MKKIKAKIKNRRGVLRCKSFENYGIYQSFKYENANPVR